VLRMLQQWLGEDSFRDGVQRYLTDHQFGSTEVTDLWDALTTESGRPVRDVMDAWIWQPGYPVVSASLDGGIATLQQRRFSLSPTPPAMWPIPVIAAVGTAPSTTPLLSGDPLTIDVGSDALRANVGGHGVYRVRYDDELTARLLANIAQLDALERFGVVDDAWAAVLADHLDIGDWISMLDAFVDDDELAVWQVIVAGLAWCRRLVPESGREALQQRIAALIRPGVARLGRSVAATDADVDRERRGLLLTALGNLADDSDTIVWARGLAGAEDLDPALAASVLSIVVAHDDGARWAATHDRFLRAESPQEQLRYLYALADFPGRTAMDATLTAAFTDARPQDAPYLLRRCLEHRDHGPIAWATITQRWDEITTRFPPSSLVRMIGGITYLLDETLRRDIADFFDAHPIPQGAGTLRQHLERHTVNVAFAQRARGQLAAVFLS
jgi:puromycin-sensitive aminopeptidase